MLCRQGITAYENIINASSSDAEVEEADIDEDALDDATYKVYETARKRLNTSLETMVHRNTVVLQVPSRNWTKLLTRLKVPSLKRTM